MNTLHVKKDDEVIVISGNDKGKRGKVISVSPSERKVLVSGVHIVKKHQKPRGQGMPGGIVEKEAAIPASKVMVVCPKCGKATKLGHKFVEGEGKASRRKVRVCKECGVTIDK